MGIVTVMAHVVSLLCYAYTSASTGACDGSGVVETCDASASACTSFTGPPCDHHFGGYCTNDGLYIGTTANQRGSLLQLRSRIHQHKIIMLAQAALGNVKRSLPRHSGTKVMDGSAVARDIKSLLARPEGVEISYFQNNRQHDRRNAASDEEEPRDMMLLQENSERVYDIEQKGGLQVASRDSSLGQLVTTEVNSVARASSDRAPLNTAKANTEAVRAPLDQGKELRKKKRYKILLHRKNGESAISGHSAKSGRAVSKPEENVKIIIHHEKEPVNDADMSGILNAEAERKIADSSSDDANATGTFKAVENYTAPAGSQLQLSVVDKYAQGIFAKLRSLREFIQKRGGLPFTFFIVCAVVLILFILAAVRYNHKDEEKKYYTDDYSMLRAASNANYDTHASLKATGTHSTPIPRQRPATPANKFVSPQPVRLHPIPRQLCPGLVVPQGNECILAVPILAQSNLEPVTAHVKDMEGKYIIQVDVLSASALRKHSPQRPLAMLRAGGAPGHHIPQAPLLGYCVASWSMGKIKSVSIYEASETSHDEVEFARVQKESPGTYTVTSHAASLRLFFQGDFRNHSITVTNDKRELLAETTPHMMHFDPSGVYYKLRVVAGVDVGLILFAMYSINCMEFD